jgi:hypothetical protein
VTFCNSPPVAAVAGPSVTGLEAAVVAGVPGACSCCDLAQVGTKTSTAHAAAKAARNRLLNLVFILLLGFCNRSNEANSHRSSQASPHRW